MRKLTTKEHTYINKKSAKTIDDLDIDSFSFNLPVLNDEESEKKRL